MAVATLKRLWRNEYFQTAIMIILIVAIVFGFWDGIKLALRTEYPALAVASQSMMPTLNVGDLIIVQGTPPAQINASYLTGDIIVFRSPYDPNKLIVHRAVYKELSGNVYYFTTHGDNNNPAGSTEGPFDESKVVGKVVGRIPNVGNFALLIHSEQNMYFFIIIVIIIIAIILTVLPESGDKEKIMEEKRPQEKRRSFGKIDAKMIYLVVVNIILISVIIFNLWGSFTFWQPGAEMNPKWVTVQGMYPDVQFHEGFKQSYNNVTDVYLSQGFLEYTINCLASDGVHQGIRFGLATFSWTQSFIVLLIIVDAWVLISFLRSRKPKNEDTMISYEKAFEDKTL